MPTANLNALRAFDAAARHLNFQRAADELHLTQGAVAQAVRRLEADLGVALFERRARGLAFTACGSRYHRTIRRAIAMIDKATQALTTTAAVTESVTVSVPPSLATKWLVPRLPDFAAVHGDIEVQVIASESLANFHTDGVDLAVRMGPTPEAKVEIVELLAPLVLLAVASPEVAGTMRRGRALRRFASMALIQDGHRSWERLLEEAGISHRGRMLQFNQTALAMDAAINGQGVALAPELLVHDDLTVGRLVELWRDPSPRGDGFHLVRSRHRKLSDAAAAMQRWLLAQGASFHK